MVSVDQIGSNRRTLAGRAICHEKLLRTLSACWMSVKWNASSASLRADPTLVKIEGRGRAGWFSGGKRQGLPLADEIPMGSSFPWCEIGAAQS